eukprot:scaffold2882_cov359-Pinguiococcus_pyrenoidosus.AAC.2
MEQELKDALAKIEALERQLASGGRSWRGAPRRALCAFLGADEEPYIAARSRALGMVASGGGMKGFFSMPATALCAFRSEEIAWTDQEPDWARASYRLSGPGKQNRGRNREYAERRGGKGGLPTLRRRLLSRTRAPSDQHAEKLQQSFSHRAAPRENDRRAPSPS